MVGQIFPGSRLRELSALIELLIFDEKRTYIRYEMMRVNVFTSLP